MEAQPERDGGALSKNGHGEEPAMNVWLRIRTESMRVYYHNPARGVTSWVLPKGAKLSEDGDITDIDKAVKEKGYKRSSLQPPKVPPKTVPSSSTKQNTAVKSKGGRRNTNQRIPAVRSGGLEPATATGLPVNSTQLNMLSREDSHHDGKRNGGRVPCCGSENMYVSVWLLLFGPALIMGASAAYYIMAKNANSAEEAWPSTPDGDEKVYTSFWSNNQKSLEAYKANDVEFRKAIYDQRGSNINCQTDFRRQVGNATSSLCEAYSQLCQLGGDTPTYFPYFYYFLLGLWLVVFAFMWLLLPILRRSICQTKGHIPRDVDLRVVMCIVGAGMAFAAMLFLVHEGRVIAVPNGHSMYTFWVFYSCYVAITTVVYWMRMDVQLIKARNPELSIGAAFVGYIISCNIMGAYYVTGIQSWPCVASTFVLYVLYPMYYLSFTRRGLEVWSVHRHHKMILKHMKALEFDSIAGSFSDSGTDSETDSETDEKSARVREKSDGKRLSRHQHKQDIEDAYGEHTYDPELAAEIRQKKHKREKLRAKKAKKRRKKQKRKSGCYGCCSKTTLSAARSTANLSSKKRDGKVELQKFSPKKAHNQNTLRPLNSNSSNSSMEVVKHTLKRRLSTADLKKDVREHQRGRLGEKPTGLRILNDPFRATYWFIVFLGFLFFLYRNIHTGGFFQGLYLGEVGCIARQGHSLYITIMASFAIIQGLSLVLLRKVKDEFAIRGELSYVTIANSIFIPVHLVMIIFSRSSEQSGLLGGDFGGCSKEFVGARAGVSLNDMSCVVTIYAYWVSLVLIAIVHTASIAYPVGLTMAQGAEKLREASVITAANFNGPKVLSSFETAMQDPVCAKYFRKFLAQEFTLDNMRILVEIDTFKTMIDPTSPGAIKTLAGSRAGIALHNTDGQLARACHTVSAWECLSGNMPITLLSVGGRKHMKHEVDVKVMIRHARRIVKK